MELKTVMPLGILLGVYGLLVYVLGPINYNFAAMAPGVLLLGGMAWGAIQIKKLLSRKPKIKTAI